MGFQEASLLQYSSNSLAARVYFGHVQSSRPCGLLHAATLIRPAAVLVAASIWRRDPWTRPEGNAKDARLLVVAVRPGINSLAARTPLTRKAVCCTVLTRYGQGVYASDDGDGHALEQLGKEARDQGEAQGGDGDGARDEG